MFDQVYSCAGECELFLVVAFVHHLRSLISFSVLFQSLPSGVTLSSGDS